MNKPSHIRHQIIQEAQQMFFSHSYSKVLMSELARRLGMSKKTLYQYFDSKEELLTSVIKEYQEEMQHEVERILQNENLTFPDKISQIFSFVGTRLHAISPGFVEDVKRFAPEGWVLLQNYKANAAFLRFNALLDEGMRKGFIRKEVNKPLAVLLYASALETILNPSFTGQVPDKLKQELPQTPAAVFDGLLNIIFHGIMA